jgi:2-C-methyl-D-erythritol 4-phosphate cytidylyltransferase
VAGGAERFHSVKNGLDAIEDENGIVAIHDAVRPLVSPRTLEECFSVARSKSSAIPVLALNDSIRELKGPSSVIADRNKFKLVQTPQCFEISQLREAFSQEFDPRFTDDASVWESFGFEVQLVEGNRENFKITTPEDLRMASALLGL